MSSKIKLFKSKRSCLIITGASNGFGRTLSIKFAQFYRSQFPPSNSDESILMFFLMARDEKKLKTVSDELKSIDSRCNSIVIADDLSCEDSIKHFENHFQKYCTTFDHYILIHNVGSTGNPNQLCQDISVNDAKQRDLYYRLNLYSIMEMTGIFLRELPTSSSKHIINITSLAAIKPFRGLVDYCVGKASREAYMKQLAEEHKGEEFRIINYSPGPLDTDMFRNLQKGGILKEKFQSIEPIKPEVSADKLIKLLVEDKFENGTRIDFHDIE